MWISLSWKTKCTTPESECPRRCLTNSQVLRDDGTKVFGCPTNAVAPWTLFFLQQYPLSEQGVMLVDGGIGDQPYFWMWAMGVIGSEIASIRMKEAEDDKRAREREARLRR